MVSEEALKASFSKVKEDIEGVKDELAFMIKRISKIEELMNKNALRELSSNSSQSTGSKRKR